MEQALDHLDDELLNGRTLTRDEARACCAATDVLQPGMPGRRYGTPVDDLRHEGSPVACVPRV